MWERGTKMKLFDEFELPFVPTVIVLAVVGLTLATLVNELFAAGNPVHAGEDYIWWIFYRLGAIR